MELGNIEINWKRTIPHRNIVVVSIDHDSEESAIVDSHIPRILEKRHDVLAASGVGRYETGAKRHLSAITWVCQGRH
jgi:hypothetical protein